MTGLASINASQNYLTDAGANPLSASLYGTFDQGGNVWDWNETPPFPSSARGLRGGYWESSSCVAPEQRPPGQ